MVLYISVPVSSMENELKRHAPLPEAFIEMGGGLAIISPIPLCLTGCVLEVITKLNFIAASFLSSCHQRPKMNWADICHLDPLLFQFWYQLCSLFQVDSSFVLCSTLGISNSSKENGVSLLDMITICNFIGVDVMGTDSLPVLWYTFVCLHESLKSNDMSYSWSAQEVLGIDSNLSGVSGVLQINFANFATVKSDQMASWNWLL